MATKPDTLLLAAGFGTRMRPLTRSIPKPLLPIYGVPLLDYHISRLSSRVAGSPSPGRIVINGHHLVDQVAAHISEHTEGNRISLSHEPEILGTGGAIAKAAGLLTTDPFVVLNADTLFPAPIDEAVRFHQDHDFLATMVLIQSEIRPNVLVTGDRVASILFDRCDPSGFTFTGLHIVSRGLPHLIPAGRFHDIRETYVRLSDDGRLGAYVWSPDGGAPFLDIGSPSAYLEAHRLLTETSSGRYGFSPSQDARIAEVEGFGYLGPNVKVGDRCRVARSVVIVDAEIADGVTLTDSILGPGVRVTTDTRSRLVTTDGSVAIPG